MCLISELMSIEMMKQTHASKTEMHSSTNQWLSAILPCHIDKSLGNPSPSHFMCLV